MNNLNEYKFFKGGKSGSNPALTTPVEGPDVLYPQHYYGVKDLDNNPHDPDEPFLTKNKRKYHQKKWDEIRSKADELNIPIAKNMRDKMGISEEDIERLKIIGKIDVKHIYYNPKDETYSISVYNGLSDDPINIKYYEPENDYIASSPDYIKNKNVRKKFDNAKDAIDWLIEMFTTREKRRRDLSRKVTESNEPGLNVFTEKGIDKKLNNLLGFDDFDKTFSPEKQKQTKRTDVGLDIIKESKNKKNK